MTHRAYHRSQLGRLTNNSLILAFACLYALQASSQQCDNRLSQVTAVEKVYSSSNICEWIASELEYTEGCSGAEFAEFKNEYWEVFVSPIRTSESGFIEQELSIAGTGKALSGQFRVGFERFVVRLLVFYSASCTEVPYLYLRLALGNPRNIDELSKEGGNTVLFDPAEGWEGQVKKLLERAIRSGVQKEISEMLG